MAGERMGVPPLVSGEPIPVGSPDRRGPLSVGLSNWPKGSARVTGAARPDLFVAAGPHSRNQGLHLCPYVATGDAGVPVFGQPFRVEHPFPLEAPFTIVESADGCVHGIWVVDRTLAHGVYHADKAEFVASGEEHVRLDGLPRNPQDIGVLQHSDGMVEVILGVSDGVRYTPDDFGGRDARYRAYDGAGIWRGGLPYSSLHRVTLPRLFDGPASAPVRASTTEREVLLRYCGIAAVNLGPSREREIIAGSHFGNLIHYRRVSQGSASLEPKRLVPGPDGVALRHPMVWASPAAYPNAETGCSDLVVGGEGCLEYYRFTGTFTDEGAPVYDDPIPVLQQDAPLYPGSLSVPTVVDWDGDGVLDIVAGNSQGHVLFFRNAGSNERPVYLPGVPLQAGGEAIHVQGEYRGSVQGPGEARWGYVCPTVFDWDGDGLPDIVMSDVTARHTVYLNRGTRTAPRLSRPRPLYCDGLPVHGTWRVQPGVARIGDRTIYVALDDDDEFHLYRQVDTQNLADGGKLRLEDGRPIRANFLEAGGTGRLKIVLADWDRDGLADLLVGTPRHGSVPDPEQGLPQSLGKKGAAVLFLKNVGTNDAPVFALPKIMKFRGEPIYLGQHACGPAVADFGGENGPDLIVSDQEGRLMYYRREDLSV